MMVPQSPMELYEAHIGSLPNGCDERWFVEHLTRYRAGDAAALRQISERWLGAVLAIAKEECNRRHADERLLDAVQEGNAALVDVISAFHGTETAEFSKQIRSAVADRIHRHLDEP